MYKKTTKNIFGLIGPGFITAALVLGPGSLAVASKIGANYEYRLLWILPLCVIFMGAFTVVSTRIGIVSNGSLLQQIRVQYGRWAAIVIGVGLFLVASSFQAGNSIGAGMVFSETLAMSSIPWIIGTAAIAISLLFFKAFFKILEKVMIGMVVLMLISFAITLIISRPDFSAVVEQFNFSVPIGSELLALAMVASSFSIAGAFYQSYLVQEKGWTTVNSKSHEREGITGIVILGVITSTVLLVGASVLYPKGIEVKSATEMGMALEPIFGSYATKIFMLGLFAASFSSLLGNATLGGVLISDALNFGMKLESKKVRAMIMLVIVIGAAVAIVFGNLPIELIVVAQSLTIIVSPLIGLMLLLIAFDKSKKKEMELGVGLKTLMILGLLILLFLALANGYNLFIK
ncbi:Nramp family divalent metal transporter [Flavobacteriaceae bacterium F89]|uniref:Nramp family divalent metal transporter n=1 Tax=Cerina litoralis TaxID=2874477 RepID=A0AAE3EW00_9FLAO|nr:Nramp family divalent metal transporter [Cerina litoralis]MCG2462095.1 Nramp family divalent metal transporter [Cerina litoralis]